MSIDQISIKSTDFVIYDIEYFKNLNSKNSRHLVFNNVDAYIEENNEDKYLFIEYLLIQYLLIHRIDSFIEEKERSKYLTIASTDSKSEALKKYVKVWSGIKHRIEKINDNKSGEYGKKLHEN